MSNHFMGRTVLITGGTGSFGSTFARSLLNEKVKQVRIFSRDEAKQDAMRNRLKEPKFQFIIGDVRDRLSVESAMRDVDYVFHAAALKQVPACEFFPMQAIHTNIEGSRNVIESAIKFQVKAIVCLSTDKAVYPINAMGMSKALMEKLALSYVRNENNENTRILLTRYGNVMMSTGSVIPTFLNQLRSGAPMTITNGKMTRFMMSLQESIDLVKFAFVNGEAGDLFVKKAPAASMATLASAISIMFNKHEYHPVEEIGIRHGEKMYETLLSSEEKMLARDWGSYFSVPLDTRTLDYQIYFEKGQNVALGEAYTSNSTLQLEPVEMVGLLEALPELIEFLNK